jgi:hypothetical protein
MEQGMSQHVAYKWKGNLYCGDDIASAIIEEFPWRAWATVGHSLHDPEDDLDSIADMFGIDRTDMWDVDTHGFPERLNDGHPGYCCICKRWFDDNDD